MEREQARGAYGMRLHGIPDSGMLVDADPRWPSVHLVSERGRGDVASETVTSTHAVLRLKTGGRLTLDRARRSACYRVSRPLGNEEMLHPFLAPAAAVFAHWEGRLSFHAGALVAGGGAWGVVGSRGAGKSTVLAWLALHGHEVLTDDVLVLDGGAAFSGPRAIDLRRETAERFGAGVGLGVVGARERWRLALPQAPGSTAFRGWLFLSWGDRLRTRAVRPSECLRSLLEALTLRVDASAPEALLDLAALPAWSFERPRDWAGLDEQMRALVELTR